MGRKSISPRNMCARNHVPAFFRRQPDPRPGEPAWKKIGGGLIAVTDGSKREYVAPGLIFGVELDGGGGGTPGICSYWTPVDPEEGLGAKRPYTLSTCKSLSRSDDLVRRPVSYIEMVTMVRTVHPLAWIPGEEEFWAEFGVGTGKAVSG